MFLTFVGFIFLLAILVLVGETLKKYNLSNKKFIFVLTILLIFNVIITYKYMEAKNNLNTLTYTAYIFTRDAFSEIKYLNKMETAEDMMKLVGIVREINKNLELLEFDLRHSKLAHNNERFHLLIKELNDNLNEFIKQHNKHFTNSNTFSPEQLVKYEKLKVELVMFEYHLSKLGSTQSRQLGMQHYSIGLVGKEKYDWYLKLEERVSNIERIMK